MNDAAHQPAELSGNSRWYALANEAEIDTPALVVYPDRIAQNVRQMTAIAGAPERLWPHVKTHKMSAIVRLQIQQSIRQFKCATLDEAAMVANAGADAVLLAHQPVGPKINKLVELARGFPKVRFLTVVDHPESAKQIAAANAALQAERIPPIRLLLDLDIGMGRTGIAPGPAAVEIYRWIASLPGAVAAGLHAYDGHIHDRDPLERQGAVEPAIAPALALRDQLVREGLPVEYFIAGGTPTFPIHARHADRQLSPGTCVLWDAGYAEQFPDLPFVPAAVVMSRVVSKPCAGHITLDLGHKSVAADAADPRVVWFDLPDARTALHNEEHWTIATSAADRLKIGDILYGIPRHICPTCALYPQAIVAEAGRATATWPIDGRRS